MNKQQQAKLEKYIKTGIFSAAQLIVIQKAIECNITGEQLKAIADSKLTWYEMQAKLLEISGLAVE